MDGCSSVSYTGFECAGGACNDGQLLLITNTASSNMNLIQESASSTAANRIWAAGGQNVILQGASNGNSGAILEYDGTSSRWRVFSVSTSFAEDGLTVDNGAATINDGLTVATGLSLFETHMEGSGTAIGAITGCGTGSPAAATGSTDIAGKITEGTTATGCTVAFANTYTNSPFCVCTANAGGAAAACDASGSTATSLVIVNTSATGDVITYHCIGRSGGT